MDIQLSFQHAQQYWYISDVGSLRLILSSEHFLWSPGQFHIKGYRVIQPSVCTHDLINNHCRDGSRGTVLKKYSFYKCVCIDYYYYKRLSCL